MIILKEELQENVQEHHKIPYAILNIEVDTHTIDVNVHPQKSEIKFSDDSTMYKAMFKALRATLSRPMAAEPVQVSLLPDSELSIFQKPTMAQVAETRAAISNLGQAASGKSEVKPLSKPVASVFPEEKQEAKPSSLPFRELFRSDMGAIFRNPEEEPQPVKPLVQTVQAPKAENSFVQEVQHPQATKPYVQTVSEDKVAEPANDGFTTNAEAISEPINIFEQIAEKNANVVEAGVGYSNANGMSNNIIQSTTPEVQTFSFTNTEANTATVWPIGQVDKTFIIAQSEDTLYLIDQHAAHERILFDKLMASHTEVPSQQLLIPLYVNMPADEIGEFEEHHDEFLRLGVDVSQAGESLLRIDSLPTDLAAEDAEDFIREIAKCLRENRNVDGSTLRQEILHTTACKAAIKAGQILNMRQMRQLLVDLFNTEHPFTCPHGRPCMIEFDSDKLYKLFKRTGF